MRLNSVLEKFITRNLDIAKKHIAHRRYRQDKKSRYKNCILKCLHFKMFAKSENSFKVIGKTILQVR